MIDVERGVMKNCIWPMYELVWRFKILIDKIDLSNIFTTEK